MTHSWIQSFPAAITVCDDHGAILEMNDRAIEAFREEGGEKLVGTNLLDCHPEPARVQIEDMLRTQRQNIYTIEKHGIKKLIYQSPWYDHGRYAGFVELSLPIPFVMRHFNRSETKG